MTAPTADWARCCRCRGPLARRRAAGDFVERRQLAIGVLTGQGCSPPQRLSHRSPARQPHGRRPRSRATSIRSCRHRQERHIQPGHLGRIAAKRPRAARRRARERPPLSSPERWLNARTTRARRRSLRGTAPQRDAVHARRRRRFTVVGTGSSIEPHATRARREADASATSRRPSLSARIASRSPPHRPRVR